jgi:teichuronic acid biosynthesis glycosyltransferase TuaG
MVVNQPAIRSGLLNNSASVVSIITPTYNSERFISRTILSVINQTYSNWEMIIVDDYSSDNSVDIVNDYIAKDTRIKLIKLPINSGAGVARNAGIKASSGRFIAFLDSDDFWFAHKLDIQISFMINNSRSFTFSSYEKINEDGIVVTSVSVPDRVSYHDLLKLPSVGCLTAIYDAETLGKVYMPLVRKRQDLGLWLKLLKKVPYGYGISDVLAQYQLRSDSISANKILAAKHTWYLYRNVECLQFLKASYYFAHYAVNSLLRTKFQRFARLLGRL